jgi:hypothetical protein
VPGRSPRQERPPDDAWALKPRYPVTVRGTLLPVPDLRPRPAHMRVAVTANPATPPRHATPARPARPRQASPREPHARTPHHPGRRHPGVKGACGVATRALRAPLTPGTARETWQRSRPRGRPARPRTRHPNQPRPPENTTSQAPEQQKLDGPLHMSIDAPSRSLEQHRCSIDVVSRGPAELTSVARAPPEAGDPPRLPEYPEPGVTPRDAGPNPQMTPLKLSDIPLEQHRCSIDVVSGWTSRCRAAARPRPGALPCGAGPPLALSGAGAIWSPSRPG